MVRSPALILHRELQSGMSRISAQPVSVYETWYKASKYKFHPAVYSLRCLKKSCILSLFIRILSQKLIQGLLSFPI